MAEKLHNPLPEPASKPHKAMEFDVTDEMIGEFGEIPDLSHRDRGRRNIQKKASSQGREDKKDPKDRGASSDNETGDDPERGVSAYRDFEDDFDYRISDSDDFDI